MPQSASPSEWAYITSTQNDVPQSFDDALSLAKKLTSHRPNKLDEAPASRQQGLGTLILKIRNYVSFALGLKSATAFDTSIDDAILPQRARYDRLACDCGEDVHFRIQTALRNPNLLPDERRTILRELDQALPSTIEREFNTANFTIRWTEKSKLQHENTPESSIVETAQYLEAAHKHFTDCFGIKPYTANTNGKIDVVFFDMGATVRGNSFPPEGPIQLNSRVWSSQPEVRQPTSTHELFHKLQYAFGFRREWDLQGDYKWFSEGTASWAEVHVCSTVSDIQKIAMLFENPDTGLFQASYGALPFWIFFEAQSIDNPMLRLFKRMSALHDPKLAITNLLGLADFETFYKSFAIACYHGAWRNRHDGTLLYPNLAAPNNAAPSVDAYIRSEILQHKIAVNMFGLVSPFGADFFKFRLLQIQSRTVSFNLSVKDGAEYSIHLFFTDEQGNARVSELGRQGLRYAADQLPVQALSHFGVAIIGLSTGASYEFQILSGD
jgi:hypothetical protein